MSERLAIISDVHGNLEALETVLSDIDGRGIETILCLGDVVGYGPDPDLCTDIVRERCAAVLKGNHDQALFTGADRFNPFARSAIRYSRERLKPGLLRGRVATERWEWLRGLPDRLRRGNLLFVHGSPRDPVNEYVYQEDVFFNADPKLREIFAEVELAVFCGHTHMPVIIRSDLHAIVPRGDEHTHEFDPAHKYLVNVGSVGQPRDRDARACWVEIDGLKVIHHRAKYDYRVTQKKIAKAPLLDEILATRLERGM